jgi:hypothetical protein
VTVHPLRSSDRARSVPPLYPEGIVADRFRIIETIGVGGSATVFEAEDLRTGDLVALKAIPAQEKLRKRARREMQAAGSLDHGAIVKLLDKAEDDDYIYVAFELVRGHDLAEVLKDRRRGRRLRRARACARAQRHPPRRQAREHPAARGRHPQADGLRHRPDRPSRCDGG